MIRETQACPAYAVILIMGRGDIHADLATYTDEHYGIESAEA
jgi:hypothetical protein